MNLELKSISVSVSDTPVVSGASLSVSSGDVALIMGPNGSGKSSLLSAIMGHPRFTVTGGSASLDGKDITALSVSEKARRGIFFHCKTCPQFPASRSQNLLWNPCARLAEKSHRRLRFAGRSPRARRNSDFRKNFYLVRLTRNFPAVKKANGNDTIVRTSS